MISNEKPLTISESEAQKILDAEFEKAIQQKKFDVLLPTDWTIERLIDKGMSKRQAITLLNEMIEKGIAVPISYKKRNGYRGKGCRAKK